ncbi:hypothetical protein HMPREF1861_01946 [Corynebacterium kroppenstedtii]|nr:hypothetical protein HMPREF1861_01946 [Corynebacterium kroppenstedtii]
MEGIHEARKDFSKRHCCSALWRSYIALSWICASFRCGSDYISRHHCYRNFPGK